ncbi:MAG TPA: lipid-A-disaccharide synthase [Caulobacteraceae bacterium]
MKTSACVMLVAAEPSGDALGAALAEALQSNADVRLIGVGGPLMGRRGIVSPFDITPLSVLGVFDALAAYPVVKRRALEVGEMAARERPDAVVLIDSWGFNLRVAHAIRQRLPGARLIKYVGPQVWATRPGRARTLAKAVDHLLTIHSFDAPWFERARLATTFVGNPVLAAPQGGGDPARIRARIGAAPDDPVLVVAPGSRRGEVERLMGPFGEAVRRLSADRTALKTVILAADAVAGLVAARAVNWKSTPLIVGEAERQDAMAAATAALACSGTVTTEFALAGAPMVVAYRLDPPTAAIAKMLIRTSFITLMNVAAGREIAPEFVQGACTGRRLAAALAPLLDDPSARAQQSAAQSEALTLMRGGIHNPAGAAARAVMAQLPAPQTRASIGL